MENKELFNNKTKEQPAQRQPMQLGLYDATNEHDACGVGMLVNIHGSKSHELVESAMTHILQYFQCGFNQFM